MNTVAEIISIGDELLIGQVVNTNAAWMAARLNLAGIKVGQVTVISDSREHILRTLREASERADIILITGGIGPTSDDITKPTLCEYFGTRLVTDPKALQMVEELFAARGLPVLERNRRQADIPESCIPVYNQNGTAPGMWFEKEGKVYISMPGVPFEMKAMMQEAVVPKLAGRFTGGAIYHKTVMTEGMGESFIAGRIAGWETELPPYIKLAYLPQPGLVRLRLTASGNDPEQLRQEVEARVSQLRQLIPDLIYGYDEDTLQEVLGDILRNKGWTLATAESCTGGYLAHLITSVPGSSDYYLGSVVVYSNRIKMLELGVKEQSLQLHGAVSKQVVKEMAAGVRERFGADAAMATSGVAGPAGGTPEKPVGTTWIAVATPQTVEARRFSFGNDRGRNITRAALAAMNMLRKQLLLQANPD